MSRFVTIWFRHLKTDWFSVRQPALRKKPFVLSMPEHGRLVITAVNAAAHSLGIEVGMVVADARALFSSLEVIEDDPGLSARILKAIAAWCIRYTDQVAIDLPEGIILDATGCAHLWGGEKKYITDINLRLKERGYDVRATMADTIGSAWVIAHYGDKNPIIEKGQQMETLLPMPAASLRLESNITDRLYKLGLRQIRQFIHMPRPALRRRFGQSLLIKLDQALGNAEERLDPVFPVEPIRERLPCLEPIVTATGIEIALEQLLEKVCNRLRTEGLGIRMLRFSGFRMDHLTEQITIGTHRATGNQKHLFKLLQEKIASITPGPGIELFMLEVLKSEKIIHKQEKLWNTTTGLEDPGLSELIDRVMNRFGRNPIHRFAPAEHHWPEKSFTTCVSLQDPLKSNWVLDRPRPLQLLPVPEIIEVTAPIPDYPPMLFRYQGKLHTIKKADGPERIEPEWWIQEGLHRDYYSVEDEEGKRYWLFREGHYAEDRSPRWFMHGFFA